MASKGKDEGRPIIIKKIKKGGGHGHHGGAWKVAYADFVTAMMAFFLLLWLLSTSSKSKLEGIAEFFTPTTGIKDSQGIGVNGGISQNEAGRAKSNQSDPSIVTGQTPSGVVAENPDNKSKTESDQDANLFKQGATSVEQAISQDKQLQEFKDNISIQMTPDGLKIDIMDTDKYPMFQQGTAVLTDNGKLILGKMTVILKKMPNYMAIIGSTDGTPAETTNSPDYSNWELSSDRAQAARRFMIKSGMETERPKKVVGMADKELAYPSEPRNPKNRRISLIMLKGSHILIPQGAVPEAAGSLAPKAPEEAPTTMAPATTSPSAAAEAH